MSNHLSIDDEAEVIEAMTPEERDDYGRLASRKTMAEATIYVVRKDMTRMRRRVRARMSREALRKAKVLV